MTPRRKKPVPAQHEIDAFAAAAGDGDVDALRAYAAAFPAKHLDARNSRGDTALVLAARFNRLAAAEELLRRGADPDARDSHRGTPLMQAAVKGHAGIALALVEAGADTAKKSYAHETALWYAKANKHPEIAAMIEKAPELRAAALKRQGAAAAGSMARGLEKKMSVGRPLKFGP